MINCLLLHNRTKESPRRRVCSPEAIERTVSARSETTESMEDVIGARVLSIMAVVVTNLEVVDVMIAAITTSIAGGATIGLAELGALGDSMSITALTGAVRETVLSAGVDVGDTTEAVETVVIVATDATATEATVEGTVESVVEVNTVAGSVYDWSRLVWASWSVSLVRGGWSLGRVRSGGSLGRVRSSGSRWVRRSRRSGRMEWRSRSLRIMRSSRSGWLEWATRSLRVSRSSGSGRMERRSWSLRVTRSSRSGRMEGAARSLRVGRTSRARWVEW